MATSQILIMVTIIGYLIGMLAVGFSLSHKNQTVGDFFLGGRRLGPFVIAMSAEASDMSSWLLMGLPGVAYLSGVSDAFWTALGLAVGTYINWLIVAKRIRKYTEVAGDAITLPDFFSNRFRDSSHILLGISAVMIVVFFVPYTASGFAACGKLFSGMFGIDYRLAMVISAFVIIGYTMVGGFLAASTTDFIQSIVMSVALAVVLGFGVYAAGGVHAVMENAKSLPGYLDIMKNYDAVTGTAGNYGALSILSTMAWGLGYFGMPHVLLRFMAIESEKKIKLSRRIASVWVVFSLAVAVLIGIIGCSVTAAGKIPVLSGADSETVIVKIASLLSTFGPVAAILAGLIISGILASTMSTADSQLLAASSSISHNIVGEIFGVKVSEKMNVYIARITLFVIAIISIGIAWNPENSIFGIVSFAWAGFGATFGPVVLFSLFWRRANKWGAIAGMVSGGIMIFVWKYMVRPIGGAFDIYELLPAFVIACLAIVIVSLLTPPPEKEIVEEFDRVNKMCKAIK